jgi:glucose-1-phosphate thymidylyltransferase
MNIIIPMAGRGKRLRPHTLTIPKPLVPVAGKPIVQHLVEDLAGMIKGRPDKIVFVTGRFGEESEKHLLEVAQSLGAEGKIAYQDEALGTAHAIWCAKEALQGPTIVAFADTLFKAAFELDDTKDGVIYVRQIDDPSSFGVVKLNDDGDITDYVEKPQTFVSDLAMIGIYYFKKGEDLAREINYLIENGIKKGGEYQLPDALRRLTEAGQKFGTGKVDEWMDCGNPAVTIETNERVLALKYPDSEIHPDAQMKNSVVIDPCFIGEGAVLTNSVVGPYVSIGSSTKISESRIERSIIQKGSKIANGNIKDSMIGNEVKIRLGPKRLSAGDFTVIE